MCLWWDAQWHACSAVEGLGGYRVTLSGQTGAQGRKKKTGGDGSRLKERGIGGLLEGQQQHGRSKIWRTFGIQKEEKEERSTLGRVSKKAKGNVAEKKGFGLKGEGRWRRKLTEKLQIFEEQWRRHGFRCNEKCKASSVFTRTATTTTKKSSEKLGGKK